MTRSFAVFALLASLVTLGQTTFAQRATGYYSKGGPDIGAESVSLIKLIANPERFENKVVRIIGYLHLGFEEDAIYLHRDDFVHGIFDNAIWIRLPKEIKPEQIKTVNDHYVICTARFVADRHGHMGLFAVSWTMLQGLRSGLCSGTKRTNYHHLPRQRSSS